MRKQGGVSRASNLPLIPTLVTLTSPPPTDAGQYTRSVLLTWLRQLFKKKDPVTGVYHKNMTNSPFYNLSTVWRHAG